MKASLLLVTCLVLTFSSLSTFATEKQSSDTPATLRNGVRPALSMNEAIHAAEAYLSAQNVDPTKNDQYLRAAIFHPSTQGQDERRWEIIWQIANTKGGTTWVDIYEDGRQRMRFGE